jgi:hypothetical protein
MTVTTVDTIIANVMFVTELNGLLSFQPLTRVPCGSIQLDRSPESCNDDEYRAIDRDFR